MGADNRVRALLGEVAAEFGRPQDGWRGRSRCPANVLPRMVAMHLMRRHAHHLSWQGIGKIMGRDHTTAINAYRTVLKRRRYDKVLDTKLNAVARRAGYDPRLHREVRETDLALKRRRPDQCN